MYDLNEIHHDSRAHASLGASSSHRWLMCPPSVRLSEHFEERPSVYAEEGTFLHELCELKLHRYYQHFVEYKKSEPEIYVIRDGKEITYVDIKKEIEIQ